MELLTERNDSFLTFLTDIGVQTCRDLHNLWPTGAAMVEEFEAKYGKHSADEAFWHGDGVHLGWPQSS